MSGTLSAVHLKVDAEPGAVTAGGEHKPVEEQQFEIVELAVAEKELMPGCTRPLGAHFQAAAGWAEVAVAYHMSCCRWGRVIHEVC